ncbi:MAG: calcium-binding protein, partial [Actinomycetota bacterium]
PGTGFLLSGDLDDGTPIEFESINPTFEETFATFSPERLFTPLGSNVVEVTFFSPIDQTTPATVDGFGAVFTDVDLPGSAAIEYFDVDGQLLHTVTAVGSEGQETLEFLGATFDDTCVATVKITAGEVPLAFDVADVSFDNTLVAAKVGNIADLVVMDDFIFGEPFVELCLGQIPTIVADGSGPVVGTDGDDVILGTDSRDVIDGRGGNDVICGERGDDTIRGGAGDDTIDGGANNDTVFGGGGDDTITDPSGTNRLNGQGGNDSISGGGADDTINGGGGRDVLRGFAGNDRINGGAGADQVAGGAGVDFCSFDGNDVTVHCEAELAG